MALISILPQVTSKAPDPRYNGDSRRNFANPLSILRTGSFPGQIVLNCRQQPHPRGDDRERITRARRDAEALFTPKPQLTEQSVPESLSAADHRCANRASWHFHAHGGREYDPRPVRQALRCP